MPCCESNVQARLPSFRRYEVRIRSSGYAVTKILLYLLIEWSQECIYHVARHVREHAYVKSLNVKMLGQESRLSVDDGQSYHVVSQHHFELRANHCWHLPASSVFRRADQGRQFLNGICYLTRRSAVVRAA